MAQRLADRRPSDPQTIDQLALGRQTIMGAKSGLNDVGLDRLDGAFDRTDGTDRRECDCALPSELV